MGTKMENKVLSYLGFAARARKLVTGYNTCLYMMEKKKIRLLLLAEDLSENTKKKMVSAAQRCGVPCKIYGAGEQLSEITGNVGKGIFGIPDENFAKVISEGIEQIQSEKKEEF